MSKGYKFNIAILIAYCGTIQGMSGILQSSFPIRMHSKLYELNFYAFFERSALISLTEGRVRPIGRML